MKHANGDLPEPEFTNERTFACPTCLDLGAVLYDRKSKFGYTAQHARPCTECTRGIRFEAGAHRKIQVKRSEEENRRLTAVEQLRGAVDDRPREDPAEEIPL